MAHIGCGKCGKSVKVRPGKSTPMCRPCRANNRVKVCLGCGLKYEAARKWASVQKYCSYACAMRNRIPYNKKTQEVVIYTGPKYQRKPTPNINPIPVRPDRVFKSVKCRQCGAMFLTLHVAATCSEGCRRMMKYRSESRKMEKDRRRARKREAYVADVWRSRVFEFDNYRCHICKKKTDPTKRPSHPRYPTIDHVIPIAKGGTHEPANCRTACFICNSRKSDRGGGEQLAMFG